MLTKLCPPPDPRTRDAVGAVSLVVAVAAWLVPVLHYQYQVDWLGAYDTLADILFLAGVAGVVLSRGEERWTAVRVGGILVIDDLNWPGGHVVRARDLVLEMGFIELYKIGTGCVMQRIR